ncbi:uncharacterized protein PSANT_00098 [Moesziomyces antarcticus]|uniref:Uncharacterized protein n=2 Tax=Pseudozyma antarctica TaxID=84753 RepID=A0A5C3FFF5_PSEA2|nr:uncharacterized protein PSANT_00098 [Moesziomyces antarcticus]
MSSQGAAAGGGGAHMTTLSTSLLAAACTAVVAASIFVLVALRRYLAAKKRRSTMIAPQSAPATAQAIYTSHLKSKSISTEDISEPRLHYAPERAHKASYDLSKMSLAQKTVVSMRQQGFLPSKPFASPKFPKAALLSPRMQPPVSADLPSPRTPKSPGLTELAMSPGPSILLKPMAYGKSPVSQVKSPAGATKKPSPEQKKKLTRSAVPSMLLRSLGVLPDFSASTSQAKKAEPSADEDKEIIGDSKQQQDQQQSKEADEPSLTPILDLGIDFGNDESFEQSLQLRGNFSFDSGSTSWLDSSKQQQQPDLEAQQPAKKSAGLAGLIEALSPQLPETSTLPVGRISPPSRLTGLPSPASFRSHFPTPPPSAGLPPAPTTPSMHKVPSSSSLQSKASRATATSAQPSAAQSFHSAADSIGQLCIDMSADGPEDEVNSPSFHRLSLGFGPQKSPSQGTFNSIFGGLRKAPVRGDDIDLEAANSSTDGASTLHSSSSDELSYSSSQTSMDLEANTSFGKANVVPAACVPPLPPMPISLQQLAQDKTPQAESQPVFADDSATPRPSRKRASTLGALDQPKLAMPDLMHPRAAPLPPTGTAGKIAEPTINVEPVQVHRAELTKLKAKSTDHLPLKASPRGAATMNFKSPYHRTLIPDPPMDGAHLSPGLGADSPILAQLSPKLLGGSPGASPRPSFTESLKARLSLSRKSLTSSPGYTSRNSTPRLDTINQFPKPGSDGLHSFADATAAHSPAAADATPRLTAGKSVKATARPATSPVVGQAEQVGLGFSPAILFNGQEIEPTRPLRFKKPSSAGGRLGGSPQPQLSPGSPSPMLHSEGIFSPLVDGIDGGASPSGERIEFGVSEPQWTETVSSPLEQTEAVSAAGTPVAQTPAIADDLDSPAMDHSTPRPNSSSDAGVFAEDEEELEYLSHRDSMISVAASTISMMSNSTCMSDSMGDEIDMAADRRAKLLASVQQNVAKAKAKDAKRESHAATRFRKSHMSQMSQMSQSSSLRNIPEELSGSASTMGLGLFESEEEDANDEEKENLADSPQGYGRKKPENLVLMPQHDSRLIGPLTPPLTPIDATTGQKQSRHVPTPSTSSASSMSSAASVPRRMRPSRGRLAPLDVGAANRLSPSGAEQGRGGATSPSSLKLRPLSLAASLHSGDSSPMKRFERPAFSPALSANIPSPGPVHMSAMNERSARYNEEGRSSRSVTYRQGGVLPTVNSKGALDTGRAGHAEPSLTHSDSSTSMGSMASSLGSFSRMGHFPSPVRASFSNQGLGKAMGMRPMMMGRNSNLVDMPELTTSASSHSFASSTGGRLGYKTSDLSVTAI